MHFVSYANYEVRVRSRTHVWNSAIFCANVAKVILSSLAEGQVGSWVRQARY